MIASMSIRESMQKWIDGKLSLLTMNSFVNSLKQSLQANIYCNKLRYQRVWDWEDTTKHGGFVSLYCVAKYSLFLRTIF